jgi:hypothetical protein
MIDTAEETAEWQSGVQLALDALDSLKQEPEENQQEIQLVSESLLLMLNTFILSGQWVEFLWILERMVQPFKDLVASLPAGNEPCPSSVIVDEDINEKHRDAE